MDRLQQNDSLLKTFSFKTFEDALSRMMQCSKDIALINHHPQRTNTYNKVSVVLTTHDAGNVVTQKDHDLARILDMYYAEYQK